MTRRRALILLPLLLVLLPVAGVAVAALVFDPDTLRPRLEAAGERATGRALTLGTLHLRLLPVPALVADGAALANLPGGSRPQMLTTRRVVAQLDVLPLLRGRLALSLTLAAPDLLLERTAAGPNWVFSPPHPSPTPTPTPATPAMVRGPRPWLRTVRVSDGVLTWRYQAAGRARVTVLGVAEATGEEAAPDAPVTFAARLSHDGVPFTLDSDTAALSAVSDAPDRPLPVRFAVEAEGARAAADGTVVPGSGAFDLALTATVPALERLRRLLPHANLPALHDLRLSTRLRSQAGGIPAVSDLTLQLGTADLGPLVPGLSLAGATLAAPAPDRPVQLAIDGALGDAGLHLGGTVGPLPSGPAPLPSSAASSVPFSVPLDLSARLGGATLALRGTAARVGSDLALSVRVADVAGLPLAARRLLPAVRDVALDVRLGTPAADTLALGGLRLATALGDLEGDLTLGRDPRPLVTGTLASQRLDVDALLAAWRARPEGAASPLSASSGAPAAAPAAGLPAAASPVPPPSSVPPPSVPGAAVPPRRLIPDLPLPFAALRRADADLAVSLAELHLGGGEWHDVAGHLALRGGRLAVEPLTMQAPEGPVRVRLTAEAGAPPAPSALSLDFASPGLLLAPLLAQLGRPGQAEGTLAVDASLSGVGATTRTLAATLSGRLGLSLVDGRVQDALLEQLFGSALRGAGVPVLFTGQTAVRCLALRLDLANGVGSVRALALDSSRLVLAGTGTLNLGTEMLDLPLRPSVRLGSEVVGVPLLVSGPWSAPRARIDASLGSLSFGPAASVADPCPAALLAARGGVSGPVPAAATTARPDRPADLLRRLFR